MIPESKINTNPAQDEEVVEIIEVDDDEIIEVEDSTADVNVAAELPPHNVYMIKWKSGKNEDAVYKGKTKDGKRAFCGAALIGNIQDEEFEGVPVFVNHINSLQRPGKPTSDLHHFANTIGSPIPNRQTVGQIVEHVKAFLEEEPVGYAEIDWKASYKNGKGEYIDLKTAMEGFPKHYVNSDGETVPSPKEGGKWSGKYLQKISHPETGEDIEARLYVRKFLTQSEANKLKDKMRSS